MLRLRSHRLLLSLRQHTHPFSRIYSSVPSTQRPTAPKKKVEGKYALTDRRKKFLQIKAKATKEVVKRQKNALLRTRAVPTTHLQRLQQAVVQGDAKLAYDIAEKMPPSVGKFDQLLCVCAKNGKVQQSFKTFNDMKKAKIRPTIFSFNYMINSIAEAKGEGAYFERANWLLSEMERFNVKMNIATFNVFLKVCINHEHPEKAIELCESMEAQEVEPDLVTYSLWMSAYKKQLDKNNPSAVQSDSIHNMENNQVVTNTTREQLKPLFDLYAKMTQKNILPHVQFFNTWLQICKSSSGPSLVFEVFSEMKKARVKGDFRTYDILLTVCAQTNRIDYGMDLFKTILHGNMPIDAQLCNSLLRLSHVVYFNAQTTTEHDKIKADKLMEQVLSMMKENALKPNLDTYHILLSVYGRQRDMNKVNETFTQLETSGLRPTIKTYTALLTAFRNTQQIEEAYSLYQSLKEKRFRMDGVFLRLLLKTMRDAKRTDYSAEIVNHLRNQEETAMAPRMQQIQEARDEESALREAGRIRSAEYVDIRRNREMRLRRLEMKAEKEAIKEQTDTTEGQNTTEETSTNKDITQNEHATKTENELDLEQERMRAFNKNAAMYSRRADEAFKPTVNEELLKMALERHHAHQQPARKAALPPKSNQNITKPTRPPQEEEGEPSLPLHRLRLKQDSRQ